MLDLGEGGEVAAVLSFRRAQVVTEGWVCVSGDVRCAQVVTLPQPQTHAHVSPSSPPVRAVGRVLPVEACETCPFRPERHVRLDERGIRVSA